MMNTTFAERCAVSEQCLPDAPYRDMLSRLHADMLSEIEALRADAERLRVGHERYETVRLLNVPQFQDAYVLNRRTGKPFDEIIDDLRLFKQDDAALQASGKADCDGGTCGVGGYCAKCKKAVGKAVQG